MASPGFLRVGSVLWDYFTGNFDRKWYATMTDEVDKILATLDSNNTSKEHIALKFFIDECRHSATDKLDFRVAWNVDETIKNWNVVDAEVQAYVEALQLHTYGDAWDEKHRQAKAAFSHIHAEMIRFTTHYSWGFHVWNNTNGSNWITVEEFRKHRSYAA
jgi:hypothetical protein